MEDRVESDRSENSVSRGRKVESRFLSSVSKPSKGLDPLDSHRGNRDQAAASVRRLSMSGALLLPSSAHSTLKSSAYSSLNRGALLVGASHSIINRLHHSTHQASVDQAVKGGPVEDRDVSRMDSSSIQASTPDHRSNAAASVRGDFFQSEVGAPMPPLGQSHPCQQALS
ncbi:hypothetical protein CEUSTIGMA_g8999.t1 [Chlamydomonas eustigma]|uniref:Uncharacterized protein n=1 Tax=Chlamydomonas eustigma TaxID=1157962 RepID=A0A250XET4_9CHLO|nr:hypothetical protein CEUSTIGMA_g8999.t1 [Chlamydomonas eustigma]|eukprot:GAX81571.1 hypothetical protein CEUSTIGMA_g8999.t1 [Chlamydomonas eustigma]